MTSWSSLLHDAWENAGRPGYRKLARMTNLNHEVVRHAINGSGVATRRTIEALGSELLDEAGYAELLRLHDEFTAGRVTRPPAKPPTKREATEGSKQARKLLVRRREALKMTQRELTELLDIGSASMSELERLDRNHTLGMLAAWSQALGVEFGIYLVIDANFIAVKCTSP
jgi:hypothetical protein